MKNKVVELINKDYMDFVNLSTKLINIDGVVLPIQMPLNKLQVKLVAMRDNMNSMLLLLQNGLKRRVNVCVSRETLELPLNVRPNIFILYY